MVTKKDLIIAILATFCLTATLFLIAPTRSTPTQSYDPWMDANEDGKIGPADFAYFSTIYGATGDTTKNVNVTNFPLDEHGNLRANLTRGSLKLFKGSQQIVALDTFEKGRFARIDEPWNSTLLNPVFYAYFSFNSKGNFNNVTRVVLQVINAVNVSANKYFNISIGLSSIDTWERSVFRTDAYFGIDPVNAGPWGFTPFYIDEWWNQYLGPNPNASALELLSSIHPGINKVRMDAKRSPSTDSCWIITYRVEVLIEYTYWDYAD